MVAAATGAPRAAPQKSSAKPPSGADDDLFGDDDFDANLLPS